MKSLFGFGGGSSSSGKAEVPEPVEEPRDGAEPASDESPITREGDRQGLWKLLGSLKGKDPQSMLSLPVQFFEPTSTLQRMAEMLHFSELLDQGADCKSSLDRLVYVATFAVTNYNSVERFYKPFNPILGETFEFVDQAKGVRLMAEQVSHHPPVSAVHCEGTEWVFWQEGRPKTKFTGNSIEIYPNSKTHVLFPKSGDHFIFDETPTTCVNNLIVGRSWIEHLGKFVVRNARTGDVASMTFEKAGWFGTGGKHVVHGDVKCGKSGRTHVKIEGRWSESIEAEWVGKIPEQCHPQGTCKELWRRPAVNAIGKYNFTEFTPRLNEMQTDEPALQGISYADLLPRTDGRIRPDRAALDRGDTAAASRLKHVMEERQRADRKQRAADGTEYRPQWFRRVDDCNGLGGRDEAGKLVAKDAENDATDEGDDCWVYVGDYWEQRQARLQWLADNHAKEAESLDAATASSTSSSSSSSSKSSSSKKKKSSSSSSSSTSSSASTASSSSTSSASSSSSSSSSKKRSKKGKKAAAKQEAAGKEEVADEDDEPESQTGGADSDGVAQDTDADDDGNEPLGCTELLGSAADFRSYE